MTTLEPIPAVSGPVRTRIAPSPTGFLHLGTARTALYSWAFARHHGGRFVLRIEDTDVARSTAESVEQIVGSLAWLGLDHDEGPFFQLQRLDRYRDVAERLLGEDKAYRCWASPAELEAMREAQRARGEKTLYDGRWRPEPGKALPPPPEGVAPVIRFRNPRHGRVRWHDLVKGEIEISNEEFDDLVIVRADGVPTYNFAVVVDDADMSISHVFRGDEHINNTPWQINLFEAIGAPLPRFGHLPIILGADGLKLSKRRGAVSVAAFEDEGFLPEAMLNYLARLGWSHGDAELFSRDEMVRWFDGSHLSKSPAQWDPAKLAWVNAHYLKALPDERLESLAAAQLARRGAPPIERDRLLAAARLFRDRCHTGAELGQWLAMLVEAVEPAADDVAAVVTAPVRTALGPLADALAESPWTKEGIGVALKATLAAHGLKMGQLAPAVRVVVCGRRETPSLDAVLAVFDRATAVTRLRAAAGPSL
jgi:glutamyl-tRNA synthetase